MDTHPVKVLFVDDDEDDYVLIRDWLAESDGHRFVLDWVTTYEGALEAIRCGQHDVYLVDYRLGARSGLDFLRTVSESGRAVPVIMLTGKGNRAVDTEAMQAGAADYLVKGQLNADTLERAIRYAIEHKQAEEALRQARNELELRVQERTAALVQANELLREEIAERQRAEQKLRDSERLAAIGTTAAKLAHEIGNPLNGMLTTIQLLERSLSRQDESDELLSSSIHDLKTEMNRLRSLLQDLRVLARPHRLDLQPTDLAALAVEVLRTQAPSYAEGGVHIDHVFPAEFPLVLADGEKLGQALLNLYKNAVEAMPEGGTLVVRGSVTENHVCLEVRDTGRGIPDECDIFEPFATTKPSGTGLGLAIVQQIVAAHNGTLSYASTPGQGTTFTVRLPLAP